MGHMLSTDDNGSSSGLKVVSCNDFLVCYKICFLGLDRSVITQPTLGFYVGRKLEHTSNG